MQAGARASWCRHVPALMQVSGAAQVLLSALTSFESCHFRLFLVQWHDLFRQEGRLDGNNSDPYHRERLKDDPGS